MGLVNGVQACQEGASRYDNCNKTCHIPGMHLLGLSNTPAAGYSRSNAGRIRVRSM
jgi:hypothetical protein